MSSTTLFSRTAANTIPSPAPQVHKFPRPIHIPRFSLDPAPITLEEDGYEQVFRNGLGQEISRLTSRFVMTCETCGMKKGIMNAADALRHSTQCRKANGDQIPTVPYRTHRPAVEYRSIPEMWTVECKDCENAGVYRCGMPTLYDTQQEALTAAAAHARLNLIAADEETTKISPDGEGIIRKYTGRP